MTPSVDNPPCWACGREIARYVQGGIARGKRRARHKCPHGVICISGTPGGATGFNGPPIAGPHHCRSCCEDAKKREGRL